MENEILDIKKRSIKTILNAPYNKADLFNEEERQKIAEMVLDTYDTDKSSREEREKRWDEIRDLLNDKKVVQKDGKRRANIIFPLIKQACKKWATEAYPLIFQNGKVVKIKTIGNDDGKLAVNIINGEPLLDEEQKPVYAIKPGQKSEKGDRRATFDNFVFMKKVEKYEENVDKMLFRLPAYGCYFKKIYFCPEKEIIKADILFPQSVVVNNNAVDNEYTIYSEELNLPVNEIRSKQNQGIYLDIDLRADMKESQHDSVTDQSNEFSNYTEAEQLFIEQYRWLDLDEDGFLEPYICSVHYNSRKLVGIYARYTEDDIKKEGNKITNIKAKQFFVKYPFIPTNDGTFYDHGFGDLLFHTNTVVDTLLNQLVDAGTLANGTQGFISKALKQRAGDINLEPGEYQYIDMFGINIREAILPIEHKEPSIVLFQLLQFILNSSKELVGSNPAFSQDMNPNLAPTTMMALVEEGSKEFKSLFKRIYRSILVEIEMVEDIIRDNPDTFKPLYDSLVDDKEKNFEEDYNNKKYDVVPISDVEVTTTFEKAQKAMFLLGLTQNQVLLPYLDIETILRRVLVFSNCDDVSTLIQTPPPAQPDPAAVMLQQQMELELEKIKSERMRIEIAHMEAKRKVAEGAVKARESDFKIAELEAKIENIIASTIKTYLEGQKIKADTSLLDQSIMDDTKKEVDNLYEPNKEIGNEGRPNQRPDLPPVEEAGLQPGGV